MEIQTARYLFFGSNYGFYDETEVYSKESCLYQDELRWLQLKTKDILKSENDGYKKMIKEALQYFKQIESLFYEFHQQVDLVVFDSVSQKHEIRMTKFLRIGYLDSESIVHVESHFIDQSFSIMELIRITDRVIHQYDSNWMSESMHLNCDKKYTVKFSASAAAIIVHEIFGHPFEDDYLLTYIDSGIKYPCFIDVFDHSQIRNQVFLKTDDMGYQQEASNQLVRKGKVVNRISTKRRSSFDQQIMTRMSCIEIKMDEREQESLIEETFDFEVLDLVGACVDVTTSNVYLFTQKILLREQNKVLSFDRFILEFSAKKLNETLVWLGNNPGFYQSYCVKNNSPLIVGTITPEIILSELSIKEREGVFL